MLREIVQKQYNTVPAGDMVQLRDGLANYAGDPWGYGESVYYAAITFQ